MRNFSAERVRGYGDSIFDEVDVLAQEWKAVNLGSGHMDFEEPEEIKAAAQQAIAKGYNQYAHVNGELILRQAVADHYAPFYQRQIDAEREVTVVSGVTEGLWSTAHAFIEPGDEIIVFEPFYECYVPTIQMAGGKVIPVTLHAPDFRFAADELRAAFSERTKVILVNTPHNPTGTVFCPLELSLIAELCQEFDVLAITDEVYEYIVFDGTPHHRLATLPGMWERTLTFSGASKTFSLTGWRIGWAIGPAVLQRALRVAHQFAVFCSTTPMQYAIAAGLGLPDSYFRQLAVNFEPRRDFLLDVLTECALQPTAPQGSYFILTDMSNYPHANALDFCHYLVKEIGVAAIPPESFYLNRAYGKKLVRFTFCKQWKTLEAAAERLKKLQV